MPTLAIVLQEERMARLLRRMMARMTAATMHENAQQMMMIPLATNQCVRRSFRDEFGPQCRRRSSASLQETDSSLMESKSEWELAVELRVMSGPIHSIPRFATTIQMPKPKPKPTPKPKPKPIHPLLQWDEDDDDDVDEELCRAQCAKRSRPSVPQ
jgi:hypothetical protein